MEYQDLRDWIQIADEMGELKTLKGCDWNLEIGAITELVAHKEDGPAVLFEDIKGYPKGYRVLSNSLSSRKRLALTLGLPAGETKMDFVKIWKDNYKKIKPIPAKFTKKSGLFDNVYKEGDIDMFKFPTPKWHDKDGGRYIGTGSVDITRDPDEGWVNYGTYRVMIHDKNKLGFYISPGKHGRIQREKYQASGKPFKMAMSFGHDPLTFLAGSIEVPYGVPEYEFIGGLRGEPFEMIEGEYSGLPIPANAEIVIEGDVHFDSPTTEGPFGEWTGYYASAERAEPWVEVKRLYHRNDPIILGCPQGKPPHEDNRFLVYLRSGMIWDQLEKAGVPGVVGVWCPPEAGNRLMTVVALKTQYLGHAKQAGLIASQCGGGIDMNRLTVVVDDHVDVTSIQDVIWAIVARCDPERGVEILKDTKGSRIDMAIAPDKRELNANSRMIIDATTPFTWKNHPLAGDIISTPERTRKIHERWGWILK